MNPLLKKWIENPYWQYFCGMEFLCHDLPIDPSSMTRFRERVGVDLFNKMQAMVLNVAIFIGQVKAKDFEKVAVDTTAQEKAIAYPTDSRLYFKGIKILSKLAKTSGIQLRQSYERVSKESLRKYGRYAHAQQFNRAKREKKKLKTWLGRIIRDIVRKGGDLMPNNLKTMLERATKILNQEAKDKNKLYAFHAPEVVCMSKGKAHKKYEFGSKVGFVTSLKGNWVLSALAFEGNPFDGHTLAQCLSSSEKNSGVNPKEVVVDKGYKGHGCDKIAKVLISGTRGLPKKLKKMLNRRQSIEPVIGHMKQSHGLDRCYLQGKSGDQINAIGAAIGFNLRKIWMYLFLYLYFLELLIIRKPKLG